MSDISIIEKYQLTINNIIDCVLSPSFQEKKFKIFLIFIDLNIYY